MNSDFARMVYGLSVVSGVFKTNGGVTATYVEEDLYSSYITGNTSFKAKAVPYEMVSLDVNLADQGVFYGADSDVEGGLVVPNSIRIIPIPSQIYTATSCVAGWSFDKNASDFAYHVSHSAEEIYKDVNAEKTLYAVWRDAEECAKGHYNRVRLLESEHGTIAVDEYREGAKVYTHDFAKDSTMLLPMGMLGNAVMVVHATPDSGYDMDSLVVDILDTVFFDGDTLPEYLKNATMTAYFSMSKGKGNLDPQGNEKQNQVRHELCKRGNAVGVYFATGKSKGNLEEYQVSLKDSLGMELEKTTLPVDSVGYWTHFALVPGKYSVLVSHKGSGEPVLDTAFTVESEIKVEKDSWKLLALSDVDKSDLDWNGDQLFYWWDESAMFGDYWKYQKYQGENANATRGYWYNSLEGRALPLRHDEAMNGREIVWELDSGWNMMANPYGWDVVLRHESISMDDNDSLVVWTWLGEESNYGRNIWLYEYEAAYVYSNKKRTLKIDAEDYFVTWLPLSGDQDKALPKKRGNTALAKASARNNWTLQAFLADAAGHRDSWNVLGVGTVAELLEPPEGMGDHVNLSVMSGKKALAKSVVAPESGDGGYSWQVALSASTDRVGYLKFEGLADLAGLGYRVYVTYEGETREVPAGDSLRVLLKAKGNTATVQVTTSQVKALATKLENLRFERALATSLRDNGVPYLAMFSECDFSALRLWIGRPTGIPGGSGNVYMYSIFHLPAGTSVGNDLFKLTVDRSRFVSCKADATASVSHCLPPEITNCIFVDMTNGVSLVHGNHIVGNAAASVRNCTFIRTTGSVVAYGESTYPISAEARNCIFVDSEIATHASSRPLTISDSIIYNSARGDYWDGTVTTDDNVLVDVDPKLRKIDVVGTDPLFNASFGASSPAFDAGNDSYAAGDFDLLGNPRVAGKHVDLGAIECQGRPALILIVR